MLSLSPRTVFLSVQRKFQIFISHISTVLTYCVFNSTYLYFFRMRILKTFGVPGSDFYKVHCSVCLFVSTNTDLACGTSTSEGCETLELLQEEKEWQVSEELPAVGCLSAHCGWKTPKGWNYGHWNWLKGLGSPHGRFSSVSAAPHLCVFCLQRTESLLGGSEPPSVLPAF